MNANTADFGLLPRPGRVALAPVVYRLSRWPLALPSIGVYAVEAKTPWDEMIGRVADACGVAPGFEAALHEDEGLFFLRQCMTACEHLTEVQHCDVDTIEYAGVHNGRHVWLARS